MREGIILKHLSGSPLPFLLRKHDTYLFVLATFGPPIDVMLVVHQQFLPLHRSTRAPLMCGSVCILCVHSRIHNCLLYEPMDFSVPFCGSPSFSMQLGMLFCAAEILKDILYVYLCLHTQIRTTQ